MAEPQATPRQVARRAESSDSQPWSKSVGGRGEGVQPLYLLSSPRGATFLEQLLSRSITEAFPGSVWAPLC